MKRAEFDAAIEQIANRLHLQIHRVSEDQLVLSRSNGRLTFSLEFTESGVFIYLYFRTTSWDWDGERTDLNDVLSVLPAVFLRIGPPYTSCMLYDVEHPAAEMPESEVYARYIAFMQPEGILSLSEDTVDRLTEILLAIAIYEAHLGGYLAFSPNAVDRYSFQEETLLRWVTNVRAALGQTEDAEASYCSRTNPQWMFYRSRAVGATVCYSPITTKQLRKVINASVAWKELDGPTVKFFKSEQSHNAVPHHEIERGRRIICQLEGTIDVLKLVPLENRLIVLGNEHLVFLEVDCSRDVYNGGRQEIIARQRQEQDILFNGRVYKWAERIDGTRFEEFARDLLSRRRGIVHVRKTSVTNEGDAGADLLCIWDVPALADVMRTEGDAPIERRTVVVQCKAWSRAVGKSDVTDIRDTLERHDASGILVIAPSVRHSLSEHLAVLRRRNIWADYWGRGELEEQLDSNPDLVRKYADLVTYAAPEA